MDIVALLQPSIRDRAALQEFLNALADQSPNIERDLARLKRTPDDKALIASLFRALHSIKGDAALCKVDLGVAIAHPIETLLGRLRGGEIAFSNLLAEVILLAMDKLVLAVEALAAGRQIEHLRLPELVQGFEDLAEVSADALDSRIVGMIEAVTGFRPSGAGMPRVAAVARAPDTMTDDLRFFRSLALQYEERSPLFEGRSERQLHLALETNAAAGNPVDPLQLEAAVYMHDVGMLFLPESLWLKAGKLSEEEKRLLQDHPGIGAGLLERMEGWQAAAEMVLQHQEMPDGKGYPRGLKLEQIVPGAKILAIVDTFESVTTKHGQYGEHRSLVRAIAEINACGNQFAPEWIAAFNTVVRRMIEG